MLCELSLDLEPIHMMYLFVKKKQQQNSLRWSCGEDTLPVCIVLYIHMRW